jgi:hypothetical protein
MACHARQPYTIEALANRNTLWRCVVCNHVVNLIPGRYSSDVEETASDA